MKALLSFLFSIIVSSLFAQANLYYRVINNVTGNWNGAGVWETSTTGANPWTGTSTPPNSTSLTISIGVGEHVTIPNGYSVSVDEVVIQNSGSITVASGGTFTVVDGSGVDLASNGTFTNSGNTVISTGAVFANVSIITMSAGSLSVSGTITSTSTFTGTTAANTTFNSGGRYRHLWTSTEGVIPLATWADGSTMEVAGYTQATTATAAGNWGQSFYDVELGLSLGNNRTVNFAGRIITARHDFLISGSGTGTSKLIIGASGTTLTVGNTFTMTASTKVDMIASAGIATITTKDFSCSGTLTFSSVGTGSGVLNVSGNFAAPAGAPALTTNAVGPAATNGIGTINFNGTGSVQTYSRVGTITNNINYNIVTNAVVDVSTNTMPGTGTFILSGTLQTSNATGLTGSLPTTGAKTFNSGSTIYYYGALTQVMGTIYPASPAANIHVTIAKTGGTVISTSITPTIITGVLTLTSGTLNVAAGHTLQLEGTVSTTAGNISMNSGGSLTINGSGALGTDPFPFTSGDQIFTNFTLNRSGAVVTFANNVSLNGALTMSAGTLAFPNQTLTLNGNISFAVGCLFSTNGNSVLDIQGLGTGATISFDPSGNLLNTLTINRGGTTIGLGSNLTITNALNLNSGSLSAGASIITMQGNTWSVDDLSGGAFVPGTGTVIFDGTTTVSATNSTDFNNVTLNASRSLDFPAATVNISGDIDFNSAGTFAHNTGTIFLNGASTQLFNGGGHNYYNITVNKTGGVTLTGGVDLEAVLDVQSASVVQSGGNLTLVSTADDPDATGSIAALLSGADVTGTVNSQRLISAEGRLYRYVSSPISGVTVADWQNDFVITGTFTGASTIDPVTGLTNICGTVIKPAVPSLYYYNEATAGSIQNGYIDYPSNGTGESIVVGRGYAPFIRETCYRDVVITTSGSINKATVTPISLPTDYHNTGSADDGWNLIGNPFPSAIAWDVNANGWTNGANLSTSVDVRDNVSGGFVTLIAGDAIAQGQAFWIQATGGSFGLQIDENAKVIPGTGSSFYRTSAQSRDLLKINLAKGAISDYAYYRVAEGATQEYEKHDFINQNNDLFDIGTFIGTSAVAVNSVSNIACGDIIKMQSADMTAGTYSFSVNREGIFEEFDVVLHDKYTGGITSLSQNSTYEFQVTSVVESKATNRFELEITQPAVDASIALDNIVGEVCDEDQYSIGITNPQPYVSYFAELNGVAVSDTLSSATGTGPLTFIIQTDSFEKGENTVVIHAFNHCSHSQLSQTVTVTKRHSIVAEVQSAISCNEGSVTLSANHAEATDYNWYKNENDITPVFTGSNFLTPVLSSSSTYYVAAVNELGCEGPRTAVVAEVVTVTEAAITVSQKNKLSSNSSTGNQWFYNDELMEGAIERTIHASKSGTYRVDISNHGCVTSASIEYNMIHADDKNPVVAYPNPFSSKQDLRIEILAERIGSVHLINATGKVVKALDMTMAFPGVWISTNDLSAIPDGFYYVRVSSDTFIKTIKVIKRD